MLLSNLKFGAFLTYLPKKEEYKGFIQTLKQDKVLPNSGITICERIAKEVKEKLSNNPKFSEFFGSDVYLVPVPKSSLMKPGMLWVSKRLAEEFSKLDMGKVFDCLERKIQVTKSSLAEPKNRPKPIDHYNRIIVKKCLEEPKKIVLIDDVITRGATLLGCATRLKEAFPDASIKAFVAVQSMNDKNFKKIEDPYTSYITLSNDNCS